MQKKSLLFCVNAGWFFLSHRLPIAIAAAAQGYDVHVACGIEGPGEVSAIESHGFTCHALPAMRGRVSPLVDIASFITIFYLILKLRPTVVHSVTAKPIMMAGIAARLLRVPRRIAALTGLGYLFTDERRHTVLTRVVAFVMGLGIRGRTGRLVLQNDDDAKLLMQLRVAHRDQIAIIRGSGVDFSQFAGSAEPVSPALVVLPARLLYDKGIREFCEAAKILAAQNCNFRFALVGGQDERNPSSIPEAQLAKITEGCGVENWGHRTDMPAVFELATVVCLPSYREGLPKVLIEAAAARRVIVTTDVPGCRDVVSDGATGFLVPPRDSQSLATAIRSAIEDTQKRRRLVEAAYSRAAALYSQEVIVRETLALYTNPALHGRT